MIYAGIGSRETPPAIQRLMAAIAQQRAQQGWTLSSGGAMGADRAFDWGCSMEHGKKRIFLPSDDIPEWAFLDAERNHPNWPACTTFARRAHARNSLIIYGRDRNELCSLVICWTKGAATVGGTGQALRIAYRESIEVHNLASQRWLDHYTLALKEPPSHAPYSIPS